MVREKDITYIKNVFKKMPFIERTIDQLIGEISTLRLEIREKDTLLQGLSAQVKNLKEELQRRL